MACLLVAKRKKAKRRRRARSQAAADAAHVVGYFASDGINALCDGDACIITGTSQALRRLVERLASPKRSGMKVRKTTFGEIRQGLQLGGAYAFDEQAYEVFRPLANRAGWPLGEEDFSEPGPLGVHFLRLQWVAEEDWQ